MTRDEYEKELKYLNDVKKSKEYLINWYAKSGNKGPIRVLKNELFRIEEAITLIQLSKHHQEVTIDILTDMFK